MLVIGESYSVKRRRGRPDRHYHIYHEIDAIEHEEVIRRREERTDEVKMAVSGLNCSGRRGEQAANYAKHFLARGRNRSGWLLPSVPGPSSLNRDRIFITNTVKPRET